MLFIVLMDGAGRTGSASLCGTWTSRTTRWAEWAGVTSRKRISRRTATCISSRSAPRTCWWSCGPMPQRRARSWCGWASRQPPASSACRPTRSTSRFPPESGTTWPSPVASGPSPISRLWTWTSSSMDCNRPLCSWRCLTHRSNGWAAPIHSSSSASQDPTLNPRGTTSFPFKWNNNINNN